MMEPALPNPTNSNASVVLITGAGSGIGAATARLFAAKGWRVALVGRSLAKLESVRLSLPRAATHVCIEADLRDAHAARGAVDQAIAKCAGVDTLILAAGIGVQRPIAAHTETLIDETLRVNAIAPANMIAQAWEHFISHQRGCVVLVSSLASSDPFTGFLAYAASKAALDSLARSIAIEGRTLGIDAFALNLGCVETPLLRRLFSKDTVPAANAMAPEVVAQVCLDCAEGRRAAQSGQCIILPSP